jgi:formylglycine-generating enzyme required for sulfatase activity
MGDVGDASYATDGEGPVHAVRLFPFEIAAATVSNDRFAAFVSATGHVTDAERFGWSFVFAPFLPDDFPETRAVTDAPWWRQVFGADWRHPEVSPCCRRDVAPLVTRHGDRRGAVLPSM